MCSKEDFQKLKRQAEVLRKIEVVDVRGKKEITIGYVYLLKVDYVSVCGRTFIGNYLVVLVDDKERILGLKEDVRMALNQEDLEVILQLDPEKLVNYLFAWDLIVHFPRGNNYYFKEDGILV
jgi:hypothetical protein